MDSGPQNASPSPGAGGSAIYFDGTSSRRHLVTLAFNDGLELHEDGYTVAAWSFADIRRADSPSGVLRVTCLTAPALARLEIRDAAVAAGIISPCARLEENIPRRPGAPRIFGGALRR